MTIWATPSSTLRAAVADLDPPFGVLDDAALQSNATDLVRRANGRTIRLATKSVRIRSLIRRTVDLSGFSGLLAYALPEALWLHRNGFDDIVVGYPTVNRAALTALTGDESASSSITLMVDDVAQLDIVDRVRPASSRPPVRVCLELDAAYRPAPGLHLGALRSPVRSPGAAARLARQIVDRPGFELVGMMAYEGQIAGVGNRGGGVRPRAVRVMQRRSAAELVERRAATVAAVRDIADLEFVNGGGTGSLETTSADESVTEVAAGSGLMGPGLFDRYRDFHPAAASFFVLPVVRRPGRQVATLAGGGWVASGPPGADRLPVLADPPGLRYVGQEGPGEVQTPVRGASAVRLQVGDQVWLRHAKAGESAEHLREVHLVVDGAVAQVWPTYRGEDQVF
ncbi:amino acid deaminase/aldolase [Lapillicoccus sp.]|uniref:amino acid deaminase/aldolase n=1 Tax=Lapillicoccus sp. TaxID=1909287 RepID=UPI003262FB45